MDPVDLLVTFKAVFIAEAYTFRCDFLTLSDERSNDRVTDLLSVKTDRSKAFFFSRNSAERFFIGIFEKSLRKLFITL